MKEAIIKIIYDNSKETPELEEGWGFSVLIKTPDSTILFDTGNDEEAFFSNAKKMNVSLEEITDVIFSHKHQDHITGCKAILERMSETTRVYLPKGFPLQKIPQNLNIQIMTGLTEIKKDIFSLVLKGGFFLYEQALILQTDKGLVIITGCAHPGIVHIVKTAKESLKNPIYLVLGGFHLFRKNDLFVDNIIHHLQSLGVSKVAPCHCSGEKPIERFRTIYQNNFYKIGTGSTLDLGLLTLS